jgi:phenylalanyl-tRNA synthetase beta chain
MQFSEQWLRSFVDPQRDTGALCHLLTMAGLEVEAVEPVAAEFTQIVVAEVLATEQHPNADRLRVCRVSVGSGEPLQIVCGAPNVAPGLKVPCALIGAQLPGLVIKETKLRGVESFGMLCSARELGISDESDGLLVLEADAPVGRDIRDYLGLDDKRITIKLTPNRADCLSVLGVAREVAANCGAVLNDVDTPPVAPQIEDQRAVVLDAGAACPRYCGRVVRGVNARAATPAFIKRALARCGVRSISALVDVTNFVMLELGQPMHAFDQGKLTGAIHVRPAREGERLTLLNGETVTLGPKYLVIADEASARALAGVMGGEDSAISLDTVDVFLESAFFAPDAIAGRARELGLGSDSSYRFERGVDFELPRRALERATRLVLDICGGQAGPVVEAVDEKALPKRMPIRLRAERVRRVLGIDLADDTIEALLSSMKFALSREGAEFQVTPPSHRFDLAIEEDLIEELARLHGYDNIPAVAPRASLTILPQSEQARGVSALRALMVGRDYQEVVNFAFVEPAWERDFCANLDPIALSNPIASQMSVMRSSLIGGLVGNLVTNLRRRVPRVRLFEVGRCFSRHAEGDAVPGFIQPWKIAGLACGSAAPEQWGEKTRAVDFFDVKADVEALLAPRVARFERVEHPALHPGRAARVMLDDVVIGVIGEVHPQWVQRYELGAAPVVFEFDLAPLLKTSVPAYQAVSKFPAVVRDLAWLVEESLPVGEFREALSAVAPAAVSALELFDVYTGKGVPPGQKSVAFRVVMQDTEKTFSDSEVDSVVQILIDCAAEKFSARLRV